MKRKIRIAISSKGRMKQPSIQLLQHTGRDILEQERAYVSKTSDPRFQVIFARAFDIPVYVHYGAVDLGMTGHDLILERESDVHELLDLKFGECDLVVATPQNSAINSINEISGAAKIATEYPHLSGKYFEDLGKQVEILELRGNTELAPKLGLAQIIVDVTSSGETLRKNDLKVIATILPSTCRLACNKVAYRVFETEINELLDDLRREGSY